MTEHYGLFKCKWWDCGWCYCPEDKPHNSVGGGCLAPKDCDERMNQMLEVVDVRKSRTQES